MSTRNYWGLYGKKKLSPSSGSAALRQLNSIHKREHTVFFEGYQFAWIGIKNNIYRGMVYILKGSESEVKLACLFVFALCW